MTNLQKFITEYNGFDRIGGGYLYDLIKHEDIFAGDKCNVDQVVAYISKSTWCETTKLIEPTCRDPDYTRRILWMSWLMLKGETMLKDDFASLNALPVDESIDDDSELDTDEDDDIGDEEDLEDDEDDDEVDDED